MARCAAPVWGAAPRSGYEWLSGGGPQGCARTLADSGVFRYGYGRIPRQTRSVRGGAPGAREAQRAGLKTGACMENFGGRRGQGGRRFLPRFRKFGRRAAGCPARRRVLPLAPRRLDRRPEVAGLAAAYHWRQSLALRPPPPPVLDAGGSREGAGSRRPSAPRRPPARPQCAAAPSAALNGRRRRIRPAARPRYARRVTAAHLRLPLPHPRS